MNCPVCSQLMVEKDFDFNVHICESGCKGIWFDHGELQKFDKKNVRLGDALQAALNYPRTNDKKRAPLKCPKCNMVMHTHKYSSAQEVNVDECYGCGGFFLDSGELAAIRERSMDDEQIESYVDQIIEDIPAYRKERVMEDRIKSSQNLGQLLKIYYWQNKK